MAMAFIFMYVLGIYILSNIPSITSKCLGTRSQGVTVSFCCDNHEDQNGICVECKTGYESVMGNPCIKCSQGYYGRKCSNVCFCAPDGCHHISGCARVTNPSRVPTLYKADEIFSSDKLSVLPTKLPRTPSIDSTTDKTSVFQGFHRREIIVYSICAGLVSFILLVCTFLLRRYKQRSSGHPSFLRRISSEQLGTDIDLHVQATGTSSTEVVEGIYETIDESSLIPDLQMSVHARNENNEHSDSSSDDNSDLLPSDGYLNPYQPIMQECVRHGYSTITHKSDSDGSSSNESDRASGYLNPYQTIVPDQDKHEYLKVNDDSYLENSHISDFSIDSPTGTYTDAHSYNTSGRYTGPEENKNQCEKLKSPVCEDNLDVDKNVKTSIFNKEMETIHNEIQQTCDIESKLCIGIHTDSTEKLKDVYIVHEFPAADDIPKDNCHLNAI